MTYTPPWYSPGEPNCVTSEGLHLPPSVAGEEYIPEITCVILYLQSLPMTFVPPKDYVHNSVHTCAKLCQLLLS